jgi:signal peptidase I
MTDHERMTSGSAAASAPAKPQKKRTAASYALSFWIKAAVTALLLWGVFTSVAGVHVCHTNSAYPSVRDGEFCLTYRLAALKTGTMIVYQQDGVTRFGRVIASGGDSVEILEGAVRVNGYGISDNTVYPTSPAGSTVSYPYQVPEHCVFVLNDYRSDISDSRTYGGIPLEDVEGAVVFTMRMRDI